MSENGHVDPRNLRSRLSHPIIDADGHWLEYGPVMREAFRKIGGEAAAEGLALASQRVPNALTMTVAERGRRRVGQELSLVLTGRWPMSCVNPSVLSASGLKRWQPVSMERGPNS